MTVRAPVWLIKEVRIAKRSHNAEKGQKTGRLLERLGLSTVCISARCPNCNECFSLNTATFLILGEICTRNCAFCAVKRGRLPDPPGVDEPYRLARAISEMGISHAVITSVTRDDLPDGGAAHFARTVRTIRGLCPSVTVELLVPDFGGAAESLATVLLAQPDVLAHNLETVSRLYPGVCSGADYNRSLRLLAETKRTSQNIVTKSGLMLGLGEKAEEIEDVLRDLRSAGCDMVTIGQYLAPSLRHIPVSRYVTLDEFDVWRDKAQSLGFKSVATGPLMRSSYNAAGFFHGVQSEGNKWYNVQPRGTVKQEVEITGEK